MSLCSPLPRVEQTISLSPPRTPCRDMAMQISGLDACHIRELTRRQEQTRTKQAARSMPHQVSRRLLLPLPTTTRKYLGSAKRMVVPATLVVLAQAGKDDAAVE